MILCVDVYNYVTLLVKHHSDMNENNLKCSNSIASCDILDAFVPIDNMIKFARVIL